MWTFLGKNKKRNKEKSMSFARARALVSAFEPAFEIITSAAPSSPLILASPHSGSHYPDSFLAQTGLPLHTLRRVEDAFVDDIFRPLARQGIPFLCAKFPRVIVDVNRAPDEWPPESKAQISKRPFAISPRARAGLGVIPTRVAPHENIYNDIVPAPHVALRIEHLYEPYHRALAAIIEQTKARFGRALLLDCHSMPSCGAGGVRHADIVLGTRYGESCQPSTMQTLRSILENLGYDVRLNDPYAGGYITEHYGTPAQSVEAIQIEINKDLYLDIDSLQPHEGMATLMRHMEQAVLQLSQHMNAPADIAAQ